jgi:hypothetical protein
MVWRAFGQERYAALAVADIVVAIGHSTSFQRCSPPSLPTLRRRAAAEMVCAATAGGETSRSRNKPAVAHDKPKVALLHDGSEDRKYAAQRVARTVRRCSSDALTAGKGCQFAAAA